MWPVVVFWQEGLSGVMLPVLVSLTVFIISVNLVRYFTSDPRIPIRDCKTHNWKNVGQLFRACCCSICEQLLIGLEGYYCDSCGVCTDTQCVKEANKILKCKVIASNEPGPWKHHWITGNLPTGVQCEVCEDECSSEPGLVDLRCCWCQRVVHTECQSKLAEVCDFGAFRDVIVPPQSVKVIQRRATVGGKLRLVSISPPDLPNWKLLIVVANCKSGNNDGDKLLSCLRSLMNPAQLIDLSARPPDAAMEWCRLISPSVEQAPIILVAGGDGTVGWVLNTIHKSKLSPEPRVGIVPLGTGNDLSRVLGWGKQYSSSTPGSEVLAKVQNAETIPLDRWRVDVSSKHHVYLPRQNQTYYMYNYMSVGVDAQVALSFHKTRESPFYIFSSRIFNKILYLCFGTQQVVERECRDLEKKLDLFLDGKKIKLPPVEAVVILNIPSWGAGVDLWAMGDNNLPEQNISDGLLEVVAIFSSFHIAQLQVGLSKPHIIGQARTVQIKLRDSVAMQVDGEPWVQQPAEIKVSYVNQASVLKV